MKSSIQYRILIVFFLPFLISCESEEKQRQRPNILFAIADDASFPHFGAYGCDWVKTPAFDRVAEEGILFTRAYTPNAKCAPSRSCIITGRNSWQLEEAANHFPFFPQKFKSYAEVLAESDYFVGYTMKGWAPGVALDAAGNKRQLTGKPFNQQKTIPPAEHISNNDYAANFQEFLDSIPEGEPFCFWYGSVEPHRAYEFGAGKEKGGKQLGEIDHVPAFWPDVDSVRTDMLDYAFEIEYFDQHLQKMLDELEKRGMLENTLVVVTSDNGMPFPRVKANAYELSNHLPLAVMWQKGIEKPGRVVDDFISFIDFAPTFLEVAKVEGEQKGMQPIQGKSLVNIFQSEQEGIVEPSRDHVLIAKERHDVGRPNDVGYPIRGMVKGEYLYIMNFEPDRWPVGNPETGYLGTDGGATKTVLLNDRRSKGQSELWELNFGKRPDEELYNITDDPDCMVNLANSLNLQEIKEQMKNQLVAELKQQEDPRIFGNGEIFDNYLYSNESSRNFYERYMAGEDVNAGWVNPTDFEDREEFGNQN